MQVVYTPAHLGHDITVETFMGLSVPANEVAERAERIRAALESDGGFTVSAPTEHGDGPITAVHDVGLLRFLGWPGRKCGPRASRARSSLRIRTRTGRCSRA